MIRIATYTVSTQTKTIEDEEEEKKKVQRSRTTVNASRSTVGARRRCVALLCEPKGGFLPGGVSHLQDFTVKHSVTRAQAPSVTEWCVFGQTCTFAHLSSEPEM